MSGKQQQKSTETKARIFAAAKKILERDGYDKLSIKNICSEATVSNGSFYHHFKTKDDLLSYYIEEQPDPGLSAASIPVSPAEVKDTIIQVYLNYVHYCESLGTAFMANYYTPKNQSLNPLIRTERPYPIVTVEHYLKKALEHEIIFFSYPLTSVTTDIRMLVIGNVFEWCLKNGATDFSGNMERSLKLYLDGLF